MGLFDDLDQDKEKDVEGAVVRYARKVGFIAEKFTSPSRRSVPDDLFTVDFFFFLIEFKNPNKPCKATPKQQEDHDKRRVKGCTVFVCNDVDEGKRIVDEQWARYCLMRDFLISIEDL